MKAASDDPRPVPPAEPGPFDCCGNECAEACVWTIHRLARQRYERELEAWQLRRLDDDPQA